MFNLSRVIRSSSRAFGNNFETLADFLISYVETGEESLLISSDQVLFNGIGYLCERNIFDIVGFTWTEKEERLLKLVLRRAKRNFSDPEIYEGYFGFEDYGSSILSSACFIKYHREALHGEHLFEPFLEDLRNSGFSENLICSFILPTYNTPWGGWFEGDFEENQRWKTGFENHIWNLSDEILVPYLRRDIHGIRPLIMALARYRPATIQAWLSEFASDKESLTRLPDNILSNLMEISDHFDSEIVEIMLAKGRLHELDRLRPDSYEEQKLMIALSSPKNHLMWLVNNHPSKALECFGKMIEDGTLLTCLHLLQKDILTLAANELNGKGRLIYDGLLTTNFSGYFGTILYWLISEASEAESAYIQKWVDGAILIAPTDQIRCSVWSAASRRGPRYLENHVGEIKAALKNRGLKERVASILLTVMDTGYTAYCKELLNSRDKVGPAIGLYLLEKSDTTESNEILMDVLAKSRDRKLTGGIRKVLDKRGLQIPNETRSEEETNTLAIPPLLESRKHLKAPRIPWLGVASLPKLSDQKGGVLDATATWYILTDDNRYYLQQTSEVSTIKALAPYLDPRSAADFSLHILKAWLTSKQTVKDGRWVFMLAGILGDDRIITLLLPLINDWCENSRHKLAEYAAQAISLLPGNEPLMVLETLANRYRNKFKNVGKACAEAFKAAATVRGITTDELGDLVVPDFGFDSKGIRRFDWNSGGASAELGADFKLTWFDPETDKAWKALPASAPAEIKTEVKTLTKLLREAVKGQTARLEMTLVRQRRWPVARWRELFENHPLLRSFASSLVWGVYESTGKLLRTFRRYPNGLLADAAGTLEELPEPDTVIGMVHPLELEAAVLDAWRAHLARFKVKAPFPQIDRPVELLDPLHGNRRSITLTDKKSASAGTFRSRAEKRGWNRGSVVDAGGISSYYKLYPGAGVEVILPTDNFWIGCDPMETIELCPAYFVKAESVERGSYVYNEPGPDDPRVLRFDAVPTVVWSETISDLKSILGELKAEDTLDP